MLTWRDLQHIVVMTAKPDYLSDPNWVTNGVGRKGISLTRLSRLLWKAFIVDKKCRHISSGSALFRLDSVKIYDC